MQNVVVPIVLSLMLLGGLAATGADLAPVRIDPAPPVLVGTLAGEPLRANANLLGTASEAEIVLQDTSPAQVAATISEEWERLGWTSETITGTGTITVSGTLNDVTYAARVDPCKGSCYPQDGDVRVRVWRQR